MFVSVLIYKFHTFNLLLKFGEFKLFHLAFKISCTLQAYIYGEVSCQYVLLIRCLESSYNYEQSEMCE